MLVTGMENYSFCLKQKRNGIYREISTLSADMGSEFFAFYGFQVTIPDDWRVEINPKNTRPKTDIAFHTPKGNRFFVSWGRLEDAKSRFASLREHRDWSVQKIKSGQVSKVSVPDSKEDTINGHEALFSRVTAEVNEGMFSKKIQEKNMLSAHFYCAEKSRYYIIYFMQRVPNEYENVETVFTQMAKSTICH